MTWSEKCILELAHHNLFESTQHRDRFRELLDCYFDAPFFTKGLCKCMYLSAMDEEHFLDMLTMLNQLTINGKADLSPMKENGVDVAETSEGSDADIYRLSVAFLTNTYYQTPDFTMIDPEEAHIIRQGLLASSFIEEMSDPHNDLY